MKYVNNVTSLDCVGAICTSNNDGNFKIIDYLNCENVTVLFIKTGYTTTTQLANIKKGNVKDRLLPSVYGVGVIGDKYPTWKDGSDTKEYKLWQGILKRCYDKKLHLKRPTYINCSMSDNFKRYEYFYEWCQLQVGFNYDGYNLDKDLLVKGNKVYSEDTCVFIPKEINLALTKSNAIRGEYPVGVHFEKQTEKFVAQLNKKGKRNRLGRFSTVTDAFQAYKTAKEIYLSQLAEYYKGKVDSRVYQALLSYEVAIDD